MYSITTKLLFLKRNDVHKTAPILSYKTAVFFPEVPFHSFQVSRAVDHGSSHLIVDFGNTFPICSVIPREMVGVSRRSPTIPVSFVGLRSSCGKTYCTFSTCFQISGAVRQQMVAGTSHSYYKRNHE